MIAQRVTAVMIHILFALWIMNLITKCNYVFVISSQKSINNLLLSNQNKIDNRDNGNVMKYQDK